MSKIASFLGRKEVVEEEGRWWVGGGLVVGRWWVGGGLVVGWWWVGGGSMVEG